MITTKKTRTGELKAWSKNDRVVFIPSRSETTSTTDRIGIVEDEEDEIIEDATDPPRQQKLKKLNRKFFSSVKF